MAGGQVVVLRYGHRAVRDYRVTSHCCLVARAFGADRIIICGEGDMSISESIDAVKKKWGGGFGVGFSGSWRETLAEHAKRGFVSVHTTMYGLPIQDKIAEIRKHRKVLLIIGSQKVERAVYEKADYNISITAQPHSEIAALAIFLHEYFRGRELGLEQPGAGIRIVPQARGKKAIKVAGKNNG